MVRSSGNVDIRMPVTVEMEFEVLKPKSILLPHIGVLE